MLNKTKNLQGLNNFVQDPKNLPFMIPKVLREESLCKAFVRSTKKKDLSFEFEGMLLTKTERYLKVLKRLESRFALYPPSSTAQDLEKRSFLFRYKGIDAFSNQLSFADKPKRKQQLSPVIPYYNARNYLLKYKNHKMVIKSRMLSLGFQTSRRKARKAISLVKSFSYTFFGKRAQLKLRSKDSTIKTYKFWLLKNLNLIGVLKGLYLKSWILKDGWHKKSDNNFDKESEPLQLAEYYRQGRSLKSCIRLTNKK